MADYKILQNIDLAQNEIKEVSKIANDRQDGKDKGLRIQTGNDTSLAFNRKIDTSNTINSIKGTVKDGTDENKKESVLNLEPSKVIISNTKGTETSTNSTITIGLTTPDSEGKEHIEAVSPSIDIKTGNTEYTDPHISLKKGSSTLRLQSNIVEIKTSESVNVGENGEILKIVTTTPKITIPSSTATDINSKTIGLGDSGSTTTVSGSDFNVNTNNTNITSTTTISGTTTIKSSSKSENTIEVNGTSTSITGNQADINPANVNIGTVDNSTVIIGKDNAKNTTTLNSKITSIASPILNVVSPTVNFNGDGQSVNFKKNTENTNIVTFEVPTHVKDTIFSVDKTTDSSITEVFKVDTSNKSTTINGNTSTIESTDVNIGITTTNAITIGRNATGTSTPTTTLQSNTTNITSPTINIGTSDSSTSVSIGKDSSTVSLKGNHNLSIDTNDTTSKVQANDLKFNTSLSSNDIKVYWDSTLNSLVFAKA